MSVRCFLAPALFLGKRNNEKMERVRNSEDAET
jgi:hypothetical protein